MMELADFDVTDVNEQIAELEQLATQYIDELFYYSLMSADEFDAFYADMKAQCANEAGEPSWSTTEGCSADIVAAEEAL
jgi:hypothetical protein